MMVLGCVYVNARRTADAIRQLTQTTSDYFAERASFLNGIKVDPAFRTLHADPRWGRLLARMGLDTAPNAPS